MRFVSGSPILNVMLGAATKAAQSLLKDFAEVENLQVSRKGVGDFVSIADKNSERIIVRELAKGRPEFNILTEESGIVKEENSDSWFVVDPLDGTSNFLHGIPHFAINIALCRKGIPVVAVTYDPIRDELFWAEQGKGAFLNQRRLRVSSRQSLEEAAIGVSNCHRGGPGCFKKTQKIAEHSVGFRRLGSAALDLAYVAAGRLDACLGEHLHPWDRLPGILLVQESGGKIDEEKTSFQEPASIIASNTQLFESFLKIIQ